jgi:GTPase SAR1 family protein
MEEDDQSEPKFNSASPSKKININNELPLMNIENIEFTGRLTIHITIIGKKKCGKSALIKSYLNKSFENEKQDTTLDIFGKKILVMGHEVSLVISEVSQDKADYLLSKEIINVSHIVFICYSLEDDIEKMNEEIIEGSIGLIQTLNKDIPIFIVGCKFDLIKEENIDIKKIINDNELTMSGKNVQDYINNKRETLENNFCGFYITSSLLNLNIQELFNDAIKTVAIPYVKKYQKKLEEIMIEEKMKVDNNKKKKQENNINDNMEEETKFDIEENGCFIF